MIDEAMSIRNKYSQNVDLLIPIDQQLQLHQLIRQVVASLQQIAERLPYLEDMFQFGSLSSCNFSLPIAILDSYLLLVIPLVAYLASPTANVFIATLKITIQLPCVLLGAQNNFV